MTIATFMSNYRALVQALLQQFPDLKGARAQLKKVTELKDEKVFVSAWWTHMKPHEVHILAEDYGLFLKDVKPLQDLDLPKLWVSDKLSFNSKKYVWQYLAILVRSARVVCEPKRPHTQDIAPPSMPKAVDTLLSSIPTNVLAKVQTIADKYGKQVESGDTPMDAKQFQAVSQELFKSLNGDDFKSLVSSIGGQLMNNSDGNLDLGNIMNMFKQIK